MGRDRTDTTGSYLKHGEVVHFQARVEGDQVVGRCSCKRWEATVPRSLPVPLSVLASLWRQHVCDRHPGYA